jgi:hypothetical protein
MKQAELKLFVDAYENYPDLASNIALDAQEAGESEMVVGFFESLGDTYIEDKEQAHNMVDQVEGSEQTDAL